MKIIEAFVNPVQVKEVRDALCHLGIENMNVGNRRPEFPSGSECLDELPRGTRIEFEVSDNQAEEAVTAIVNSTSIVEMADNDVFASRIADAIHIRDQANAGGPYWKS